MSDMTITLELGPDLNGLTYAEFLGKLLDRYGVLAVTLDLRTPSSASQPLLTIVVERELESAKLGVAREFGCIDWRQFVTEFEPELS